MVFCPLEGQGWVRHDGPQKQAGLALATPCREARRQSRQRLLHYR